jgi:hypothetical protein
VTKDEMLALEAGPELERLVAEKVMEWTRTSSDEAARHGVYRYETAEKGLVCICRDVHGWDEWPDAWWPSRDIAAAWLVVERVRLVGNKKRGLLDPCIKVGLGDQAFCEIFDLSGMGYVDTPPFKSVDAWARTAPLAICRAALLAIWE